MQNRPLEWSHLPPPSKEERYFGGFEEEDEEEEAYPSLPPDPAKVAHTLAVIREMHASMPPAR